MHRSYKGEWVPDSHGNRIYDVTQLLTLVADKKDEQLSRAALRVAGHALTGILDEMNAVELKKIEEEEWKARSF